MIEDVYRARSGRLLLTGGNHDVGAMFKGEAVPSPKSVETLHENIATRAAYCSATARSYRHYVFPDPLAYAIDELPDTEAWCSFYLRHYAKGSAVEHIRYPLERIMSDPALQMRTDTHYSPLGHARLAADIAAEILEIDPEEILEAAIATAKLREQAGDLGVKFDPPETEEVLWLPKIAKVRYETNGVMGGNDGMIDLLESPEAVTERTLLIFGDSFFRAKMFELARYWRRIVVLRSRFFYPRLVEAVAPDDVLSGMAERYLRVVQRDSVAPDFFALPLWSGRGLRPSKGFGPLFSEMVDRNVLGYGEGIVRLPFDTETIADHFALVLWQRHEGRLLDPADRQEAWRKARATFRAEAKMTLAVMERHGLSMTFAPK